MTPEDPSAERAEALAEIDEASLPHEVPRNSPWKLLLRIAFSLGFLALLFWQLPDVSLDDLLPDPTAATFIWIAAAISIHLIAYVLQNLRWAEVSDTLGIHLGFRRLFSHLLAGQFVSNALPTSFGGDIVRIIRQGNDTGDYADSFAATSLERLTGWLVLPLLSFAGLAISSDYRSLGNVTIVIVAINTVTIVALVVILAAAAHPRLGALADRRGWRRYLGAVHLGIIAFRHRPVQAAKVLAAGIGFQLLQCVTVWACAEALGIGEIGIVAALTFFPPTAVVQNFPLALGGLGVREAAFVYFFGAIGVSNGEAIALGLLVYLVFVLSSLSGAPSFVSGGFTGASIRGAGRHDPATPAAAKRQAGSVLPEDLGGGLS
ncbi:MAG: lysylphosphatidylglycerol synthase transmembrane domain-containing protein [Microthrixaceae bacterium]